MIRSNGWLKRGTAVLMAAVLAAGFGSVPVPAYVGAASTDEGTIGSCEEEAYDVPDAGVAAFEEEADVVLDMMPSADEDGADKAVSANVDVPLSVDGDAEEAGDVWDTIPSADEDGNTDRAENGDGDVSLSVDGDAVEADGGLDMMPSADVDGVEKAVNGEGGTMPSEDWDGWDSGLPQEVSADALTITSEGDEEPAVKNIIMDCTAPNIKGAQASSLWFGNYEQSSDGNGGFNKEPVKWRVLKNADKRLFLLSDRILDVMQFYPVQRYTGGWVKSTLRSWLNGYAADANLNGSDYSEDNFKDKAFSSEEYGAVAVTEIKIYPVRGGMQIGDTLHDKTFLLSYHEARKPDYGFTDYLSDENGNRKTTDTDYAKSNRVENGSLHWWWMITPGNDSYASWETEVLYNGLINQHGTDVNGFGGVRPAINVNLDSVLFTSRAEGGKASGDTGANALSFIGEGRNNEWKLTLLDDGSEGSAGEGHKGFSAERLDTGYLAPEDEMIIGYSGAATGPGEYVSAILFDDSDEPIYYGRIVDNTGEGSAKAGTASVAIPTGLADGDYTLKVFSEQYNGDKKTDYASSFAEITFTVSKAVWGEIPREIAADVFEYYDDRVPEGVWYAFRDNEGKWHKDSSLIHKEYTGSALTLKDSFMVFHEKRRLYEKKDYTVKYANNKNAAGFDSQKPPQIKIKGKGSYYSTDVFGFIIDPADIGLASVNLQEVITAQAGKKLSTVTPKVTYKGKKLKAGKDYDLAYYSGDTANDENLISNPSAQVMQEKDIYLVCLKGKGNFDKEARATVVKVINGGNKQTVPVSKLAVTDTKGKKLAIKEQYTGEAFDPAGYFDNSDGKVPKAQVRYGNTVLEYGKDYTIASSGEIKSIGKYTITVNGKDDKVIAPDDTTEKVYVGTKKVAVTITGVNMKNVKIAGLSKSVSYNGGSFRLSDAFNKKDKNLEKDWNAVTLYTVGKDKKKTPLKEGSDYTVSITNTGATSYAKLYVYAAREYVEKAPGEYELNTSCIIGRARSGGEYQITYTGKNGFEGTIIKKVKITPYDIKEAKVPAEDRKISVTVKGEKSSYSKTGAIPEVAVYFRGIKLTEGVDYKLSYKNNKKIVEDFTKLKAKQRPTVTITGMGNYKGKWAEGYFNIHKTAIEKAVRLEASDVVYKGKGKKGYFLAKPALMDNGSRLKSGKNKDVEAIPGTACIYTYKNDTILGDGTEKKAGDPVDPSDKVMPGTEINLSVTVFCSDKSSYISKDGGSQFSCSYKVIDSSKNLGASKVSLTEEGKGKFVYNNCNEVVITESDLSVVMGSKKEQVPVTDYEIVSVKNNRYLGTATFVIRGKGDYGGKKTFKLKLSPKNIKRVN